MYAKVGQIIKNLLKKTAFVVFVATYACIAWCWCLMYLFGAVNIDIGEND